MEYAVVACLSVIVLYVALEGWTSLARLHSWHKLLNRLDELEWDRVVSNLRASASQNH